MTRRHEERSRGDFFSFLLLLARSDLTQRSDGSTPPPVRVLLRRIRTIHSWRGRTPATCHQTPGQHTPAITAPQQGGRSAPGRPAVPSPWPPRSVALPTPADRGSSPYAAAPSSHCSIAALICPASLSSSVRNARSATLPSPANATQPVTENSSTRSAAASVSRSTPHNQA